MHSIRRLFDPKRVVVFGASSNPEKLGSWLLQNLLKNHFAGEVLAVHPKESRLQGVPAFPSVEKIDQPIDLALISLPDRLVPQILDECGSAGVGSAIVYSCGFGEGEDRGKGKQMAEEVRKISVKHGIRVLGPNCMGVYNAHRNLNATFFRDLKIAQGTIGYISQSGSLVGILFHHLKNVDLHLSKFASIGNMVDINQNDLLEYLADDPQTEIIALYLEAIKDGAKFVETARKAAAQKPVICLQAGTTESGKRAALSHTGNLAGATEVFREVCRSSGVLLAGNSEEFADFIYALSAARSRMPSGKRAAIVTISGGASVLAADTCETEGIELPRLSEETRHSISSVIPGFGSTENPVDMTAQIDPAHYSRVVRAVAEDPHIDGILAINVGLNLAEFGNAFVEAQRSCSKPFLSFVIDAPLIEHSLRQAGIPNFASPERVVSGFRALYQYQHYQRRKRSDSPPFVEPSKLLTSGFSEKAILNEWESKRVLCEYGLPVVGEAAVQKWEEAESAASEIGYPVVLKILSSHILHKSEAGGVHLKLEGPETLRNSFVDLKHRFGSSSALLVQEYFSAEVELIVGVKKDPVFGPVLLCGLGGVLAELTDSSTVRLCPISLTEAQEMIRSLPFHAVLEGFRNLGPFNLPELARMLSQVSAVAVSNPEIEELDINPLALAGKECKIVDSLLIRSV